MTAPVSKRRPNGWMVQRDNVSPPQYLSVDGEWVPAAGLPTWFVDADAAQAASRPTGTDGTVIQMWDATGLGGANWRVERRRCPRLQGSVRRW